MFSSNRRGFGFWNESWAYSYNPRGQLTNETFAPQASTNATYAYTFDSNKLGIRTGATVSGALSSSWQAGTLDNLAHLTLENWNVSQWHTQARGFAIGADSVSVWLDDAPLSVLYDNASTNGLWQAEMSFGSGSHNVRATAYHPLSRWSTNATNVFIAVGLTNVASAYDAVGNVTNRTFSNGRVQTLYWDAFGRLMQVRQRDAQTNGFDWTAVYDALGRRLQTVNTPVSNNVAQTSTTIDSWFDPQVEFLEIGVAVNGARTWKVNGPDLNGGYGTLQGVGGLEATLRESDGYVTPVLNDSFGNIVATIYGGQVVWAYPKLVGYGPVAGYSTPVLSTNVTLADATLWRSHRMDPTGFFWLGARYYDANSGRFFSPDPLGHEASMDLYSFANGDPVNYFDPDGRDNIFNPGAGQNAPPAMTLLRGPSGAVNVAYRNSMSDPLIGGAVLIGGSLAVASMAQGVAAISGVTAVGVRWFGANYVSTLTAGEAAKAISIGAGMSAIASGTVAYVTDQPVVPAVQGGLVSGSFMGLGGGAVLVPGRTLVQALPALFTIGSGSAVLGDTVTQVSQKGWDNVSSGQQAQAGLIGGGVAIVQGSAHFLSGSLAQSVNAIDRALAQKTTDALLSGASDDAIMGIYNSLSGARNNALMQSLGVGAFGEYGSPFVESSANALLQNSSTAAPVLSKH